MHSKLYKQLPFNYNLIIITRSHHLASYIQFKYEHKKYRSNKSKFSIAANWKNDSCLFSYF